ncbi:MAG TPA: Clp protease N-terminal domain-containing protein [Acidimicrobiia bacterium]|nr:Clp protease N-terminal domain-containing protein [Acidimicrobiia bacterium]
MEGWTFTLRDAQVTIAREYGFDSWTDLMAEVEGERVERWGEARWSDAVGQSMMLAHRLGHRFVMGEHVLLQLLAPKKPTAASEVLDELGIRYDDVLERLERMEIETEDESQGTGSTPVFHMLRSLAQGIAIGMGSTTVTDEHVLLAIAYGDPEGHNRLVMYEFDPDDVVDGLRARGIVVPRIGPLTMAAPVGPWGPFIYYLPRHSAAVHEILTDRYPPGTVQWGTNTSRQKEGYVYVHGEDEIPMEEIVKGAVQDPSTVEVVPFDEGLDREAHGRRGST